MLQNAVLIVGAGPTGLVLAIELVRRGVPVHLIDRLPQPLGRDRAIAVKSRSLEVLAGMGLAETFIRRGHVLHGLDLFSGGTPVASVGLDGIDSPFPFILCLPEEETERILTEEFERLGGHVERGVEFAGLEQRQHSVRAQLRTRHDGEHTLEASWVIGTDGLHSAVRETIGDAFDGHDYPEPWGVVDARLSGWNRPDNRAAVEIEPPVVIAFPLRDGRWRFTFQPAAQEDEILTTIGARLAAISPDATLQDPDTPQLFHTHARVARYYRFGRILLAGDAAHASTPFEGHGMNTGIQDAYNLGWKLALVVTGAAPDTLLDSYEAERRPIAQAIACSGDDAEARATSQGLTARKNLIQFLATPEGRQAAAVAEAEVTFGYDQSPIVDEGVPTAQSVPHSTRVGFRVGDAGPLAGRHRTCRLHELIGMPIHTLLLMLGDADPALVAAGLDRVNTALQRYRPHMQAYVVIRKALPVEDMTDELLCDPTGSLHKRLGADQTSLCLVRPDGHLGLRVEPPAWDRLQNHLQRILLVSSEQIQSSSGVATFNQDRTTAK